MQKKILAFLIIIVGTFVAFCDGNSVDVRLEISDAIRYKDEIQKKEGLAVFRGEPFKLKVIVSGNQQVDGDPTVEGLEQFRVQNREIRQSRSMINSDVSAERITIYHLVAKKNGHFVLGPARVEQRGRESFSKPISIRVIKKTKEHKTAALRDKRAKEKGNSYEVFCELSVDKKQAFVGEPVLLIAKIYSRGDVAGIEGIELQVPDGFGSKEVEKLRSYHEERGGKKFSVHEKKHFLFANKVGDFSIDPIQAIYRIRQKTGRVGPWENHIFQSFFSGGMSRKVATSNSLDLRINDLPKKDGAVADAVGTFRRFELKVDKKDVEINEPLRFTVEIEGEGNLDLIAAPKVALPAYIKMYESKTETEFVPDEIKGIRRFEFVMQVGRSGHVVIPSQEFIYLDTATKEYKTIKSNEVFLNIERSQEPLVGENFRDKHQGTEEEEKGEGRLSQIKQDIHFIIDIEDGRWKWPRPMKGWLFLVCIFFVPFPFYRAFFCEPIFRLLRRIRFAKGKSLSQWRREFQAIVEEEKYEKAYDFFSSLVADSYDLLPGSINEETIQKTLYAAGLEKEKVLEFLLYMSYCAQYAFASSGVTDQERERFVSQGMYWVAFFLEQKKRV
jgi:hypothetical protein